MTRHDESPRRLRGREYDLETRRNYSPTKERQASGPEYDRVEVLIGKWIRKLPRQADSSI